MEELETKHPLPDFAVAPDLCSEGGFKIYKCTGEYKCARSDLQSGGRNCYDGPGQVFRIDLSEDYWLHIEISAPENTNDQDVFDAVAKMLGYKKIYRKFREYVR